MLHLPKNREVLWNGSELRKMTNLKMLSIENANFSRGPEFLPSSLRVLKWRGYPTQSLPPEFDPRRLVSLDLSLSRNILGKQLNLMVCTIHIFLEMFCLFYIFIFTNCIWKFPKLIILVWLTRSSSL